MITDSLKINLFSFWILSFFLNSAIHFAHIQRPCSNRKKKKELTPQYYRGLKMKKKKKDESFDSSLQTKVWLGQIINAVKTNTPPIWNENGIRSGIWRSNQNGSKKREMCQVGKNTNKKVLAYGCL